MENDGITHKIHIQSWVHSPSSPTLHSVQYRVLEEERQGLQTISNVIDYLNFLEIRKKWYGTTNVLGWKVIMLENPFFVSGNIIWTETLELFYNIIDPST